MNAVQDNIDVTGAQDTKKDMLPYDVRVLLSKMTDEDIKLMGFDPKQSRPEWMVIKNLAVTPPPVRPSVQSGDGKIAQDDLTFAYRTVVRTNNELRRLREHGGTDNAASDVLKNLKMAVASLMDNNIQSEKLKH